MDLESQLSRRQRQIMDIVYSRGRASGTQIAGLLVGEPPSRGAMRTMLRILEEKGLLMHVKRGKEFIYLPMHSRQQVGPSALRRVVDTFFAGSIRSAVAAHLAQRETDITDDELRKLAQLVRQTRGKGR